MLAIRNFEKISRLPHSPMQSPKQILVLNYAGRSFGLTQSYLEHAFGLGFSAVIPDLPRILSKAAHFGEPAAARKSAFRDAILRIARAVGANPAGDGGTEA